jgi:hypothetical protein
MRGRRLTRSAFALLAAISVLLSVLVGGRRYFVCAQMDEVRFDACCAPADHGDRERASDQGPTLAAERCCKVAHFAAAAPATIGAEDPGLRAPLVAVLPVPGPLAAPVPAEARRSPRLARAGPCGPSPRERRLKLMISLS